MLYFCQKEISEGEEPAISDNFLHAPNADVFYKLTAHGARCFINWFLDIPFITSLPSLRLKEQ